MSEATSEAKAESEGHEEEVSPAEDLMREHGVLNRVLLVYEEGLRRLGTGESFDPGVLHRGATLVRSFVEDYHEKLEEEHLFPRFENAGKLVDLVTVLRAQHQAGRRVTDRVLALSSSASLPGSAREDLGAALRGFIRMYRPHEAREDTVLFLALRGLVSKGEWDDLGEEFEEKEHALFGEQGFDDIVAEVAELERALGIHDLAQFTAS